MGTPPVSLAQPRGNHGIYGTVGASRFSDDEGPLGDGINIGAGYRIFLTPSIGLDVEFAWAGLDLAGRHSTAATLTAWAQTAQSIPKIDRST